MCDDFYVLLTEKYVLLAFFFLFSVIRGLKFPTCDSGMSTLLEQNGRIETVSSSKNWISLPTCLVLYRTFASPRLELLVSKIYIFTSAMV